MRHFISRFSRYGSLAALVVLVLIVMMQSTAVAQQTGTITGTVQDVTGAVVPGATVVLTNQATRDLRQTVSNGEGFFTFAGVVTGTYDIKVDMKGFRSWELKGLKISPNDKRYIADISLAVGSTGDIVTVEAVASQAQVVDSGELSATLTTRDIKNLALQGRDVTELVKTLPGFNTTASSLGNVSGYDPTVTSVGSAIGNGYSANGVPNRAGGVDLLSDGAHVIDPGCNCNATQTINADMVQEVKVSTSAYNADSSKGPVLVQAVGKSGSTDFHGSTYLHFRDASMNSNDWSANHAGIARPDDRYWYPGGNFGGPVKIPGTSFNSSKKLVFWTGYEYYNQKFPDHDETAGILKAIVPTEDMRAGNFDPNSAGNKALCSIGGWQPYCGGVGNAGDTLWLGGTGYVLQTNNQLPAAMIDPSMKNYINAVIPLPNVTPSAGNPYNFLKVQQTYDNGWMYHARVDDNINDSNKVYFSLNLQRDTGGVPVMQWWAPPQSLPFPGGQTQTGKSQTYSLNYVHIFSPTLTNEFTASLAHYKQTVGYDNMDGVSRSGIGFSYTGLFKQSEMVPALTNGWWIPGIPMFFQADNNGYVSEKVLPSFGNNLTKIVGTHTLKTGFNWERTGNKQLNYSADNVGINGQFTFGTWGTTGNPVANMVMGAPTSYSESNRQALTDLSYWTMGFFGQDDWKISRRLTLSFGVRASHDTPWTDSTGKYGMAIWDASLYQSDVAAGRSMPGMRWNASDSAIPMSGRTLDTFLVSPRFGVAFDMFGSGKTVLRGGFGSYFYHDQYNDYAGAVTTSMGLGTCTLNLWQNNLAQIDAWPNPGSTCVPTGVSAVDPNDKKQPVTYTYNFTVSQQTFKHTLLEVSYVGNQSTDLQNPLQNRNAIPLGTIVNDGVIQVDPKTGTTPSSLWEIIGDKNGFNRNDYRPYLAYGKSFNVIRHGAWANYNALQVAWTRPRGALTYGLNYTFSKTLGINGGYNAQPDPFSLDNDYGILNTDRTHVINATYSYEIGNRYHGNSFLAGVLNGWMISGITSIQSGMPLGQTWKVNFGMTGDSDFQKEPGTGPANYYIDPTAILGSPDYTIMPVLTCNPASGLGDRQYYNPSCFSIPAVGTNGKYQNVVRGPGYWNSDVSLGKTFKITERQNAEFKLSAFNFLNHPLWSFDPNDQTNLNLIFTPTDTAMTDYSHYTGASSLKVPTGVTLGQPNTKFGRRVVELTFKYNF